MELFKIPKKVKYNAKIALYMRKEGYNGGTETGIKRGEQLANNEFITKKDARNMRAWFARHYYTSYPNYKVWEAKGRPIVLLHNSEKNSFRGSVAYGLWGGREGREWVNSLPLE